MGYYATSLETNFKIPTRNLDAAFEALNEWRELFPEDAKWLYFGTAENLKEVFTELGFEVEVNELCLELGYFDSKWHGQDKVLAALKDFVSSESYVSFVGEDHEMWRWTPAGVMNAVISWV